MVISPIVFRAYAAAPVSTGHQRKIPQSFGTKEFSSAKSMGKEIRIAQLEAKISDLTSKLRDEKDLSPEEIAELDAEIKEAQA